MASGKAKWIDEMVHAMLSSLLQSIKEGKRGGSGIKKEAWQKARIAANTVYGTKLDLIQCKTKYAGVSFLLQGIPNNPIVNSKKAQGRL